MSEDLAAKKKQLAELRLHIDVIDAVNKLSKKHDVLMVLEQMREWVAFMDKAKETMNRE